MNELLTTRQVALELQVSESSVKRWCDQGLIATQRTAGGHRRIVRSALQEFLAKSQLKVRDQNAGTPVDYESSLSKGYSLAPAAAFVSGYSAVGPAGGFGRVSEAVENYSATSPEELVRRFQQLLLQGDEAACREQVQRWLHHLPGLARLGDALFGEALERIGRLRVAGNIEVFEERRVFEICLHLLAELRNRLGPAAPLAPLAIGGTLAGDHYLLATQMVELVLREAGWNATNLGADLPLETLLGAVRRQRPRLLWLSISHVADPETFLAGYNAFYSQLPTDLIVAVGGRALTDDLRPRMRYTAHCDNLERLSALGHALVSNPPTPALPGT